MHTGDESPEHGYGDPEGHEEAPQHGSWAACRLDRESGGGNHTKTPMSARPETQPRPAASIRDV